MKKVAILTRNGQVEQASKDLKNLWLLMCKLLNALGQKEFPSYTTVTRHVQESGTFVHIFAPGQSFEIITRELMYTRRGTRKRHQENAQEELAQIINK